MAGFAEQINTLAARAGVECKVLHTKIGDLAALNTTDKTSVVKAISEVKTSTSTQQGSLDTLTKRVTAVEETVSTNLDDIAAIKDQVTSLQEFETSVGDVNTSFVEAFESALA